MPAKGKLSTVCPAGCYNASEYHRSALCGLSKAVDRASADFIPTLWIELALDFIPTHFILTLCLVVAIEPERSCQHNLLHCQLS